MTYEQAKDWLAGKNSMVNLIPYDPQKWQVYIAEADAAMIQQAYWIVRAHKESLLSER